MTRNVEVDEDAADEAEATRATARARYAQLNGRCVASHAESSRYPLDMQTAIHLLADAMQLPEDEREELAAALLDTLEPRSGIAIEDREEIERRAADARSGAPGIPWDEVKQSIVK
jgi:putative addiction module component (TIGR02574 family)